MQYNITWSQESKFQFLQKSTQCLSNEYTKYWYWYFSTCITHPYMLGMNDWCSYFGSIVRLSDMECFAFIRHLVIEFVKTGRILKLPKVECFQAQKFPYLASFGLAQSCQFLALKHTSLLGGLLVTFKKVICNILLE